MALPYSAKPSMASFSSQDPALRSHPHTGSVSSVGRCPGQRMGGFGGSLRPPPDRPVTGASESTAR